MIFFLQDRTYFFIQTIADKKKGWINLGKWKKITAILKLEIHLFFFTSYTLIQLWYTTVYLQFHRYWLRALLCPGWLTSDYPSTHLLLCSPKTDFKIDQQIVRHFVYYSKCLLISPSILCDIQLIYPFLNSMIASNDEKELVFQPIVKPLYPLFFL